MLQPLKSLPVWFMMHAPCLTCWLDLHFAHDARSSMLHSGFYTLLNDPGCSATCAQPLRHQERHALENLCEAHDNGSWLVQRNMKPQIRQGPEYQAAISPKSEVKPRPVGDPSAEDRIRGGTLVPSADAVLASVAGPEKAAAEALPMDAKMDPNESIGGLHASCVSHSILGIQGRCVVEDARLFKLCYAARLIV